jgi:hypothetical protein
MSSKLLPNKSARQVESQGPPGSLVWRIVAYQREEALKRRAAGETLASIAKSYLLWSTKTTGGTGRNTPVRPPMTNVNDEADCRQHRRLEHDPTTEHREQPVEDFDARRRRDDR